MHQENQIIFRPLLCFFPRSFFICCFGYSKGRFNFSLETLKTDVSLGYRLGVATIFAETLTDLYGQLVLSNGKEHNFEATEEEEAYIYIYTLAIVPISSLPRISSFVSHASLRQTKSVPLLPCRSPARPPTSLSATEWTRPDGGSIWHLALVPALQTQGLTDRQKGPKKSRTGSCFGFQSGMFSLGRELAVVQPQSRSEDSGGGENLSALDDLHTVCLNLLTTNLLLVHLSPHPPPPTFTPLSLSPLPLPYRSPACLSRQSNCLVFHLLPQSFLPSFLVPRILLFVFLLAFPLPLLLQSSYPPPPPPTPPLILLFSLLFNVVADLLAISVFSTSIPV